MRRRAREKRFAAATMNRLQNSVLQSELRHTSVCALPAKGADLCQPVPYHFLQRLRPCDSLREIRQESGERHRSGKVAPGRDRFPEPGEIVEMILVCEEKQDLELKAFPDPCIHHRNAKGRNSRPEVDEVDLDSRNPCPFDEEQRAETDTAPRYRGRSPSCAAALPAPRIRFPGEAKPSFSGELRETAFLGFREKVPAHRKVSGHRSTADSRFCVTSPHRPLRQQGSRTTSPC
jgi:hypothetical protein